MSADRSGQRGSERLSSAGARGLGLWRELPQERRLAAIGAVGLFITLFLPWYQAEVITGGVGGLRGLSYTLTGWQAFTWVEAAVLLVAVGVLFLLVVRARGNAFHVPGGDGGVITAAGLWTCVLVLWRMFDKQGVTSHSQYDTATGIEWGIFIALAVAAFLTWSGTRIRAAHEPEPPLPGEAESRGASRRRRWRRGGSPGASAGSAAPASAGRQATTVVLPEPTRPSPGRTPGPDDPPTAATERHRAPTDSHDAATQHQPVRADWDEAATQHQRRPAGRDEAPTERRPARADRSEAPTEHRGLDPREIQELNIAEPPAPTLRRSRPSTAGRPPAPPAPPTSSDDDQLTIRLDRPN